MGEVAFHTPTGARLEYACRLLRRAVAQHVAVRVLGEQPTLQALDEALWAWGATEFIAHAWSDGDAAVLAASCVWLGGSAHVPRPGERLLNLAADIAPDFAAFERVIEVVGQEPLEREQGRARWRRYLALGVQPVLVDAVS